MPSCSWRRCVDRSTIRLLGRLSRTKSLSLSLSPHSTTPTFFGSSQHDVEQPPASQHRRTASACECVVAPAREQGQVVFGAGWVWQLLLPRSRRSRRRHDGVGQLEAREYLLVLTETPTEPLPESVHRLSVRPYSVACIAACSSAPTPNLAFAPPWPWRALGLLA